MDNQLKEKNGYEGNGWSKYQMMVMAQLTEHNEVFKTVNSEINKIKQDAAIEKVVCQHMNNSFSEKIKNLEEKVAKNYSLIEGDRDSLEERLSAIEGDKKTTEKADLKIKGLWAMIGGGAMILINVLIKIAEILMK